MFRTPYPSQMISLILLSIILLVPLTSSVRAQENIGARQSIAPITMLDSNKEQDGLIGPVHRVRTEMAKFSTKSGKLVEEEPVLLETTTYDVKGNRIENSYYPIASSSVTGKEEYKYDDKGHVIEMTVHDSDGSVLSKEIYKYEFDSVGNWTKMSTYIAVLEAGKLKYEPIEVTYRTISYYFNKAIAEIAAPKSSSMTASSKSSAVPSVGEAKAENKSLAGAGAAPSSDADNKNQVTFPPPVAANNELSLSANASGAAAAPFLPNAQVAGDNFAIQVKVDDEPPASSQSPKPAARLVTGGVLNSKVISLPKPHYPEIAMRVGATGTVVVEISLDENGFVSSARAVSGPATLQAAAVEAARRARFSPALLSGRPVPSTGVINYTFSSPP